MVPTTVKTRPEATLFCKKDVLGVVLSDDRDGCTIMTVEVTVCICTDEMEGVVVASALLDGCRPYVMT